MRQWRGGGSRRTAREESAALRHRAVHRAGLRTPRDDGRPRRHHGPVPARGRVRAAPPDDPPAAAHPRRPRLPAPGLEPAVRPRPPVDPARRELRRDAQRLGQARTSTGWSPSSASRPTWPCSTATRSSTSPRRSHGARCGCSPRSAVASCPTARPSARRSWRGCRRTRCSTCCGVPVCPSTPRTPSPTPTPSPRRCSGSASTATPSTTRSRSTACAASPWPCPTRRPSSDSRSAGRPPG